jgi:hypothetical protein
MVNGDVESVTGASHHSRSVSRFASSLSAIESTDTASAYAGWLLASAGHEDDVPEASHRSPHEEWAASGAMALTGTRDGPPLSPGWQIASAMRGAALALRVLGGPEIDGPALLGERAAHAGFTRNGAIAPGGSCRILPTADGWVALNLARPSDVDLANAWLDDAGLDARDPWPRVASAIAATTTAELLARAAGLGLAFSAVGEVDTPVPFVITGPGGVSRQRVAPIVVDLSSLWAGPLCANLLAESGARVVNVESAERPDAMRRSAPSFFELLHHGHELVVLAMTDGRGRDGLRRLLEGADVVIEASRPRALAQLGIDATEYVERGTTWVSITGYGRSEPDRIGFGDDVGVAAGIVADFDVPRFCADAIADPIAGLHAAVAALAVHAKGGGRLVDVSMAGAARAARGDRLADTTGIPVAPPRSRSWR